MKIVEDHIVRQDDERSYAMGDPTVIDIEDTIFDDQSPGLIGAIFRFSQKQHGRCVSKVYIERVTEDELSKAPVQIGWVFQKREKYEDSKETFIHETWVSLYDEWKPTIVRVPHVIREA